ncbi:Phage integrase [Plesiocystis pacifica SIR-1]|uniref:Phage integrase n=1 Tax=Plesiocystis pacifica SIR-1 TaxID=391625 RepID=A6GGL9_9BACT|nr:site-specific integrase [Plesiocystis pacifica]EDM74979.1 Phage integrase [Plesiocystis pacifica SIR-1]
MPTLAEFAPRYMDGYVRANRQKPSTIESKESHLNAHLIPKLGEMRLDQIDNETVQRLKGSMSSMSNKTVNNVLTTLNTMLKCAVEWKILEEMPARIRLLKVTKREAAFFDFDEYERLVAAAGKVEPWVQLMVLLGGDAGMRPGEVRALHWTSVDFQRQRLTIERNEHKGSFLLPKHDKIRRVPMTDAVAQALSAHRHLRGPLVFYRDGGYAAGKVMSPRYQRYWLDKALRRANLPDLGPHTLRHTFCSHLAMRGAPARAIMELAGHRDLLTTQGYMHLSPAALESSIGLLNRARPSWAQAANGSGAGSGGSGSDDP